MEEIKTMSTESTNYIRSLQVPDDSKIIFEPKTEEETVEDNNNKFSTRARLTTMRRPEEV